jgi:hypothetical protein
VRFLFEMRAKLQAAMTNTLAITLKPIFGGWAVCLSDGRRLALFRGPGARLRALRYVEAQWGLRGHALGHR